VVICPRITPQEIRAMSDEELTKLVVERITAAFEESHL
jgi:hypothetical protein